MNRCLLSFTCQSLRASLHFTLGLRVPACATPSSDLEPATLAWGKTICSEYNMKLEMRWMFVHTMFILYVCVFAFRFQQKKHNVWKNGSYKKEAMQIIFQQDRGCGFNQHNQYWHREKENNEGKRMRRELECNINGDAEPCRMQRARTEKGQGIQ